MRRSSLLAVIGLILSGLAPASAADVVVEPVSFSVSNPLVPGVQSTVRGNLYLPAGAPECSASVMLLIHGLSYGVFGWDFPGHPETYSVARTLAARGHPAVAIDLLGYGTSDDANGYTLTVESYAAMTDQIVGQLRSRAYGRAFDRVGLMGHSAGTEIGELTAALYRSVDVLVATGYTHFPSQRIVTDFFTGDFVRAAQDDYEYFGGDEQGRSEYMYNLEVADPAIVAADNALANPTPSGEIYSIGPQPSRYVMETIDVPVLLVLSEKDLLFPSEYADEEMLLLALSGDKTLHVVPQAGHSFMLHPNAPETNDVVASWLEARADLMPGC